MIIIPDANFVISALIKRGKAFELFEWNDFIKEIRFIAPEHLSTEVRRNLSFIVEKSKLSDSEISELLDKFESQIEFVPFTKFRRFVSRAFRITSSDDFVYIALALVLKFEGNDFRVLTNDKILLDWLEKAGVKGIAIHELLRELGFV
jgi:predicted nucleic acid-binding protein